MRTPMPLQSLAGCQWQPMGVPGLRISEMSRDPASGDRTVLLASSPRPGIERKAQYHLGEEEFYCLEGRFTFDGIEWFEPGTYVHFPSRTVHGAQVQVPAGYLLYLRTSGDPTAHRIGAPVRPWPYLLDAPCRSGRVHTSIVPAGATRRVLRSSASAGLQVEWIPLEAGETLTLGSSAVDAPVEIFLICGSLESSAGEAIQSIAYGCYPNGLGAVRWYARSACVVLAHIG